MTYSIIGVTLILAFTIIIMLYRKKRNSEKAIAEKVRAGWSHPKEGPRPFYHIKKYAEVDYNPEHYNLLQRTRDDIDFEELFSFIDRTSSKVGQQYLYKRVTSPTGHMEESLKNLTLLFSKNATLREKVLKQISVLNSNDAYFITSLLRSELMSRPSWLNSIYLSNFLIIILLIFSLQYQVLLIFLLVPFTANMLVHYWNKTNTFQFVRSFPQLSILVDVASGLNREHELKVKGVAECVSILRPFQWKIRFISMSSGGPKDEVNQIVSYLIELVKGFFLMEVLMLFHLVKALDSRRSSAHFLFKYVGQIDMALSIASLRAGSLKTCQPEFIQNKKEMVMTNVYHPLIPNCVTNNLSIEGKSILITGSNMSGKTTFLRTIILNCILGQSIDTCFADEFKTPVLQPLSAIRIDDDILEGKSYYFEEVSVIGSLVKEAGTTAQHLFVLDEVFKGTNTLERVAAAKAVLSYLTRNNHIVIVSTHDVELSEMLNDEYELYHFTETIQDSTFHFDHKIKPGSLPITSFNAIRILELLDFPGTIISEAKYLRNKRHQAAISRRRKNNS
jgi:DNA mismatch repair ATPase MutS